MKSYFQNIKIILSMYFEYNFLFVCFDLTGFVQITYHICQFPYVITQWLAFCLILRGTNLKTVIIHLNASLL